MGTITVSVDQEWDIAIYTLEGDITYSEIRDAIDQYYRGMLTRYTLWDFSAVVFEQELTSQEIQQLARQVSAAGDVRRGGFDVIVVPSILKYGLARMYAAYTEYTQKDPEVLRTLVFYTKDAALSWIKDNVLVNRKRNNG
jgi:hypothetical protein